MLPAEFTQEQYAESRRRVRTCNRSIARAIQTDDEKALVSAIQESKEWSEGVTENRFTWTQDAWHAAHGTERLGATASAAFHAFRPELLAQLHEPQLRPVSEIDILGAQHETNLGERVVGYDQLRTVQLQVLLENYQDPYGHTERRLAAYELDDQGERSQRIEYLPKDAPSQEGPYLATLQRSQGQKRIAGTLSPLRDYREGGNGADTDTKAGYVGACALLQFSTAHQITHGSTDPARSPNHCLDCWLQGL